MDLGSILGYGGGIFVVILVWEVFLRDRFFH